MTETIRLSYKGWNITVTCLTHHDSDPSAARRFTGRAFAVLEDSNHADQWHDARMQTASIVDHIFPSANVCAQTLLVQIQSVIDGLCRQTWPARPMSGST